METCIKYKFELVKYVINKSILSNSDILGDVNYGYSNPMVVEIVEIAKIDSVISKRKKSNNYDLESHRIIVKEGSDCNIIISDDINSIDTIIENAFISDKISDNINNEFIKSLHVNCLTSLINYYKNKLVSFFIKTNVDKIIERVQNSNWVITSEFVYSELLRSDKFRKLESNGCYPFKRVGCVGFTVIYTYDDIQDNEIYFGSTGSFTSLFNRNATIEKFYCGEKYINGLEITIEYLFKNNGVYKIILK